MPVWSTPGLAVSSPSVVEHHGCLLGNGSAEHLRRRIQPGKAPRRGWWRIRSWTMWPPTCSCHEARRGRTRQRSCSAADRSHGRSGRDRSSAWQHDQDLPSSASAAGLVVFGLAAGLWAAGASGILDARKRTVGEPGFPRQVPRPHAGERGVVTRRRRGVRRPFSDRPVIQTRLDHL